MARDLRLTQFSQTLDEVGADDAYRTVGFEGGVSPILVQQPSTFRVLSQSGEAVCWGAYLTAPAALFPDALIERPKINYTRAGPKEFKTTWSYVMALASGDTYDKAANMKWPTDPNSTPGFTDVAF